MTNYEIKTCFEALAHIFVLSTWRKEYRSEIDETKRNERTNVLRLSTASIVIVTFALATIFAVNYLHFFFLFECRISSFSLALSVSFFFFHLKCKTTHLQSHCRHLTIIISGSASIRHNLCIVHERWQPLYSRHHQHQHQHQHFLSFVLVFVRILRACVCVCRKRKKSSLQTRARWRDRPQDVYEYIFFFSISFILLVFFNSTPWIIRIAANNRDLCAGDTNIGRE